MEEKKFTIYIYDLWGFWKWLVADGNRKQNPNESFMGKYQKCIAFRYSYKLVCADDKFSKHFKS